VRIWRFFFALVCLSALVTGCATPENVIPPKVNLVNITPAAGNLFEQRFVVDLRVSNVNDFDIPLDGLSFDMEVNGSHFATGVSNQEVVVPRLGSAVVSVDASASSIDLFRQILGVARSGTVEYKIVGTALVGGLTRSSVPFERFGKLNLIPDPYGRQRFAPEGI
jgi:LEA14-like dessication related protein